MTTAITIDDLVRIQVVSDAQISPDGTRLLFLRKRVDEKNRYLTSLWSVDALGGKPVRLTQEEEGLSQGRFAPDGARIAFVSRREERRPQLYVLGEQGEAARLATLPEGTIGAYRWSPDGKHIALAFRPELAERRSAAAEERKARGLSTPPVAVDNGWYRTDGDGYFGPERFAIHLLDVETGSLRRFYDRSAQGLYVFEWTPDSRALVIAHSTQPNPWAMSIEEGLFVAALDGSVRELKGAPKGRKIALAVSPDGRAVAYLGSDATDDFWGVNNNQLYLVPFEGAGRCLSTKHDRCLSFTGLGDVRDAPARPGFVQWSPDGQRIFLNWNEHGESCFGHVELATGELVTAWKGKASLVAASLSADGKRAGAVLDDSTQPTEAAVIDADTGTPRRVTEFNSDYLSERAPLEPEELWVTAADGHRVHAWVLKPKLAPGSRVPAVLSIHGGPHAQYCWGFFHEFQALAALGIAIVYPNPRGSKGYGQAHCAAIRGAWGDRDWEDVQAVTRWMKSQSWIDPSRLGIMGGSYGGYMAGWAIGHSKDFRAAIIDRCVSNLVSMCGTSDFYINKDMLWPGSALGGLEAISVLWKQSPLAYFDRVTTPALVIHSEGDLRCNIEQGEQVFAALQIRGVESRFVRYPRECSHGMSRSGPADLRIHRLSEMAEWWRKYLLAG